MSDRHDTQNDFAAISDFILLNEEIAALVRARLPLEPNLARLAKELPRRTSELATNVRRLLEAGRPLSEAIDQACGKLPAAYRATVAAGIAGDNLADALESLTDAAIRREQLRRVVGFSALYPLILLVVMCLGLALVVGVVMPNFQWLNGEHFGPFNTIAGSRDVIFTLAVILPAVLILFAAYWWWRSGRIGRSSLRELGVLRWLPWVRRIPEWANAATFSDLLKTLVERGVPLDLGLLLAAETTGDATIDAAARDLSNQIRSGKGTAAERFTPTIPLGLPPLVRFALRNAHDRPLLAGGLHHAAVLYRERALRRSESFAEVFPILMTLILGGLLTLAFAAFVFWPYVSLLYELASWDWR
jgi:type II secretory pathway component PulF